MNHFRGDPTLIQTTLLKTLPPCLKVPAEQTRPQN